MIRRIGRTAIALALCTLAICAALAFARGKTFINSGFEHGDFKGWQTKQEGDSGHFVVYKGTPAVESYFAHPGRGQQGGGVRLRHPRRGKFAAANVQEDAGTRVLTRTLNLKPHSKRKLSFLFSYKNAGSPFVNPTPDSLHAASLAPIRGYGAASAGRGTMDPGANQQYRIDIMRKGADTYSIKNADVLMPVIASEAGDQANRDWKRYGADLSSLPAGKVTLRIAEADNVGYLNIGFDALKLIQTKK